MQDGKVGSRTIWKLEERVSVQLDVHGAVAMKVPVISTE